MPDFENYDALIFDMDGTLVDSVGPNLEAWRLTCEKYGYPWDEAYMDSLGGVPTVATVECMNQNYGMSLDAYEVGDYKETLFMSMDVSSQVFPLTYQIMRDFALHKPVAVGTGASRLHAEKILLELDVLPHLTALVTATDVVHGKPAGDTFVLAAKQMGVDPSRCLVFEDTPTGINAARAAQMDCQRCYRGALKEFIPFIK